MRRVTIFVLLGAAVLAAAGYGLWQVSRARCFALTSPVVCRVETSRPMVALTFDDGPTARGLDAVLPVLDQQGAKATFFLIGHDMRKAPDLARRIVGAGHEIGSHTLTHQQNVFRSQSFYDREVRETEALLKAAGGGGRHFRPPYGKKLIGLPLAVRDQGLTMVLWSFEEPTAADPQAYAREVVAAAKPGAIIIMHPMYASGETARQALPLILQGLRAKGLEVVTVSTLMDGAL
jgi:peptidoglycan/xylan/chitin deacetylase (PgdA/CDA1 family)